MANSDRLWFFVFQVFPKGKELCHVLLFFLLLLIPSACTKENHIQAKQQSSAHVTAEVGNFFVEPETKIIFTSFSPLAIQKLIMKKEKTVELDLTPIWKAFRISNGENNVFESVTAYDKWQASTFTIFHPKTATCFRVLKISTLWQDDRRYLIFKADRKKSHKDPWQFVGNIDFIFDRHLDDHNKNYHRIVISGKKIWLILRTSSAGSGMMRVAEEWYQLDKEIKKVLEYPVSGNFGNDQVCNRTFASRILNQQVAGKSYVVRLRLSVSYANIIKRQLATYRLSPDGKFIFDTTHSDLSVEEMDQVYGGGFIQNSLFLKFYKKELMSIAKYGKEAQKEWLRESLQRMSDSTEKRDLQRILGKEI